MQTVSKCKRRSVFIHWQNQYMTIKYLMICLNKLLHPHSRREVDILECTCPSIRSWLRSLWLVDAKFYLLTELVRVWYLVWYDHGHVFTVYQMHQLHGSNAFFSQFPKFFYNISSVYVHTIFLCKTPSLSLLMVIRRFIYWYEHAHIVLISKMDWNIVESDVKHHKPKMNHAVPCQLWTFHNFWNVTFRFLCRQLHVLFLIFNCNLIKSGVLVWYQMSMIIIYRPNRPIIQ